MSQAGLIDVEASNPQIPTSFTTDDGTAIPIVNNLEILGTYVAATSIPVETVGSGKTVTVNVQLSDESVGSDVTKVGLASFDASAFTVDANGFVTLNGGGVAATDIQVDIFSAPGTNPVVPLAGVITITGDQVAPGSIGENVIQTNSLLPNTLAVEIQRSSSAASSDKNLNGVSHYNSGQFTIDSDGFVSLTGAGLAIDSFSPDSGTDPVVPDGAGLVNMAGSGSITTVGSLNTLTTQLTGLTNHAVLVGAGTSTITKLAVGTNGQVLIGATGADPAFATITSTGGTVSFTAGANTLDMEVSGGGIIWTDHAISASVLSDSGSFSTASVTLTTPASPANGDVLKFVNMFGASLIVTAAGTQLIRVMGSISSAGGTQTSTVIGDSLDLVYQSSSTTWVAIATNGNWVSA